MSLLLIFADNGGPTPATSDLPDSITATTRSYLNERTTESYLNSRTTRSYLNERTTEDA